MEQKLDFKLLAIIVGGLLFTFLFWMERLALNLLLYSVFICIALLFDKGILKSRKLFTSGALHLLAGALVVYNQSVLTVFTWYISLAVFVGFAHAQLIRSVFTAIISFLMQLFTSPFNLIQRLINIRIGNFSLKPLGKPIKYVVLPILVLLLFTALYSNANEVFAQYLSRLTDGLSAFFTHIYNFFFADLSIERVVHVIIGLLFTAAILLGLKGNGVEALELKCKEQLIRNRKRNKNTFVYEFADLFLGSFIKRKMALKTENIIGILCFAMLNLLLLFLNLIDLSTLWLNTQSASAAHYATELHDGTNILIFSIVLAMIVILYFFNGNLNFYRKNKTLKLLAFIWIVQNTFLVLSVGLRDYNYVLMYGLTYKRIGVAIFLMLCTVGLITVYLKVAQRKTFFFLCKANGMVWYALLFVCCFANWDVFIVEYNLKNQKASGIDVNHLTDLSDKTLPLLDQNRKLLYSALEHSEFWPFAIDTAANSTTQTTPTEKLTQQQEAELAFNKRLDQRIADFKERYTNTTWLSWNYRDWQTHQYFQ
ncbi:DUF4173 domain-containing protein [Pedobacter sp. KR3-3]|uniref:DUF4173 domain-containing protein n=1 Tax=Pedobacter albus TaxID=3113905 RepID=A0ABU7I303_9SPHI|nr:DUF4173 domain-containing protein [Pedobacter sp. KR3-3]MEE1943840.1 DUF4173 domain-containing protein [Pedobacter sp. KR3-3]